MKHYQHNKNKLAIAVARNDSKHSNQLIWVGILPIKSVKSMKFADTTTISVCPHYEMPNDFFPLSLFHKGKEKKII